MHRQCTRRTPSEKTAAVPFTAATPLHILLAEDDELMRKSLSNYSPGRVTACGGRATAGRRWPWREEGGFDLLLLDVHMPELDGFQVVRAIREREQGAGGHLHVIALTARSRKEDRERCLAAGMDDFRSKPVQAADLLAAIARVQGDRRGDD